MGVGVHSGLAAGGPGLAAVRSVAVIDDERTVADLLRVALSGEPDLDCVGVAYDLRRGVELVAQHAPQVVVLDVHFRGEQADGITAAGQMIRRHPEIAIVLLTGRADAEIMRRAADAGVSSLMPKDGSLPELLTTVRTAHPGGLVVHPGLLRTLVSRTGEPATRMPALSGREADVLDMMMMGFDTRTMADTLGISVNTCRGYVKALLRKLNAHSSLEAVAIARQRGLDGTERLG